MGVELYNFLEDGIVVNGLPGHGGEDTPKYFNGIGDLAAQLIVTLKMGGDGKIHPGNLYLYPYNHKPGGSGEEYLYEIGIVDMCVVLNGYSIDYDRMETHKIFGGKISELSVNLISNCEKDEGEEIVE